MRLQTLRRRTPGRTSLVALAAEQQVMVLEDNCYHLFAYDAPARSLQVFAWTHPDH